MSRSFSGPTVVLVGRPNVGKSTLFNRITGTRRSIVAPVAGTTRDVLAAPAAWQDRTFTLVDTGGLFGATTDPLHALVVEHGLKALAVGRRLRVRPRCPRGPGAGRRGDCAATSRDGEAGHPRHQQDRRQARAGPRRSSSTAWASSPCSRCRPSTATASTSCSTRSWRGCRREVTRPRPSRTRLAVAIVGRPNVGKSSLVNRLLREERVMVSEMPGTTRDTVDVVLHWQKRQFRILDTAGMRRPGRVAARRHGRSRQRRAGEARDGATPTSSCWSSTRPKARATAKARSPARQSGRLRHRHRRQQVGPGAGPGPGLGRGVRRQAAVSAEVPGVRADRPRLGADRRAHAEAARGGRPGGRRAAEARADVGAQPVPRNGHRGASADEQDAPRGADPLRRADRRSRRRRSCSSPTSRPSCTSRTSGSSSTGCASRSASKARRFD